MPLKQQVQTDLNIAVKAKKTLQADALKYFFSEIKYAEIAKQKELTDQEIINLLNKEVKKREEAIVLFNQGGRQDLVASANEKLKYLKSYLPAQLDEEALKKIICQTVKQNPNEKNFGVLMKNIMLRVGGQANGGVVSRLLAEA